METPNRWVVVRISAEGVETIYKVFATWYGGYLGGDSWRMNSGIADVEDDGESFIFIGHSGSRYQCLKHGYGLSGYGSSIINKFIQDVEAMGGEMVILEEDHDFLNLLATDEN